MRFTQDGAAAFLNLLAARGDYWAGHARLGKLRLGRICAHCDAGAGSWRWKIRALASVEVQEAQ